MCGFEQTVSCKLPTVDKRAADPEITHLQFIQNQGLLLAVVSGTQDRLVILSLSTMKPIGLPVDLPAGSGKVTAFYVPESSEEGRSSPCAYIGTDQGEVLVFSATERRIQKCVGIEWRQLFPCASKLVESNPVTAIKTRKDKPHKVLFSFKHSGAIVWNFRVKMTDFTVYG